LLGGRDAWRAFLAEKEQGLDTWLAVFEMAAYVRMCAFVESRERGGARLATLVSKRNACSARMEYGFR
jgi:hypothetical protein